MRAQGTTTCYHPLSFPSHHTEYLQQQGTRLFTRNAFILLLHEWVSGSLLLYMPSDGAPFHWQIWWLLVCAKKKSSDILNLSFDSQTSLSTAAFVQHTNDKLSAVSFHHLMLPKGRLPEVYLQVSKSTI